MKTLKVLALDALGLAGIAAALYGIARIYEPAALIVGGLVLTTGAFLLSRGLK